MDNFTIKQLGVDDWQNSAKTSNLGAVAFYQKHGFKIYGEEPNSLKIENQYFNEYIMVLVL